MTQEQDTAMYDQPDHVPDIQINNEDIGFADAMRTLAGHFGYSATTITVNGSTIDIRDVSKLPKDPGPSEIGQAQPSYSPHQKKVLDSFLEKHDIYASRAAVYKDNYKVVGRVMQALFPDGAPRLYDATDYDRWHIFELIIVKLTRYTNNWDTPHKDSIDDMQVYGAILGALDSDMAEREERRAAEEAEELEAVRRLRAAAREAASSLYPVHPDTPLPTTRAELREQDNEARMYTEDEGFAKAFDDDEGGFKE